MFLLSFFELYQKFAACQRKGQKVLMRKYKKYLFPGLLLLLLLLFLLIYLLRPNRSGVRIITEKQPDAERSEAIVTEAHALFPPREDPSVILRVWIHGGTA